MAFNEELNKLLEETQKTKPFNYDIIFIEKNEFKKKNTLLEVKFKALAMEQTYVGCSSGHYPEGYCEGLQEV